ncbi:MAG: hypothetical protein Q7T50_00045, partial [Candidatus Magasanikbacteria bacterium]|nr:hypothetical protein [Candidatus Magasanikbacteria bacterium]
TFFVEMAATIINKDNQKLWGKIRETLIQKPGWAKTAQEKSFTHESQSIRSAINSLRRNGFSVSEV